jgi:hypothetical protein
MRLKPTFCTSSRGARLPICIDLNIFFVRAVYISLSHVARHIGQHSFFFMIYDNALVLSREPSMEMTITCRSF